MKKRPFKLVIQSGMYKNENDKDFLSFLDLLEKNNYYGVELNIIDIDNLNINYLKEILHDHRLKLTNIATGQFAKNENLSLIDPDKNIRNLTIKKIKKICEIAYEMQSGMIFGFIKGKAGYEYEKSEQFFIESLLEINNFIKDTNVKILIESTNRYESSIATNLDMSVKEINMINDNSNFRLLPDTYHMNIEETSKVAGLIRYKNYYESVHISDNNRYFPGFGMIDFKEIFAVLQSINFKGYLGIEGNIKSNLLNDIELTTRFIDNTLSCI